MCGYFGSSIWRINLTTVRKRMYIKRQQSTVAPGTWNIEIHSCQTDSLACGILGYSLMFMKFTHVKHMEIHTTNHRIMHGEY
jgi:hypothetical protein